jgi:hypothetical protein
MKKTYKSVQTANYNAIKLFNKRMKTNQIIPNKPEVDSDLVSVSELSSFSKGTECFKM